MLNKAALVLAIIGALNWGSIGLFKLDLVASIFRRPALNRKQNNLHPGRICRPVVHNSAFRRRPRGLTLKSGQLCDKIISKAKEVALCHKAYL